MRINHNCNATNEANLMKFFMKGNNEVKIITNPVKLKIYNNTSTITPH